MKRNDNGIDALWSRLELLERQNRRMKRFGIILLVLAGSLFLMGQAAKTSRTVEATKFILKNAKGKKRAELGIRLDGPELAFYDDKEQTLLSIGLLEEGPGLLVLKSDGKKIVSFSVTPTGPMMSFSDQNGAKRLNLSVVDGSPAVGLLGTEGDAKAALGLTPAGNPFVQLFGSSEHGGAQLLAAPDMAVLRFLDSADKPRAVFGMLEKENAPGITFNDADGATRAVLMLLPKGPGLDFLNENKVVTWHAP
ncbi:MAG: hypothetical protein H6Q04_1139 [Acidobacteria bacterium]|jgi:hypothetical protein|nr:hypothetical protein [Acidobacteriota bacterium]